MIMPSTYGIELGRDGFGEKTRALRRLWSALIGKISPGQFKEKDALITTWRILPISILEGRLNNVKKNYLSQWFLPLCLSKSVDAGQWIQCRWVREHEDTNSPFVCASVLCISVSRRIVAQILLSGFDGKATCQLTMISCDAVMEIDRKWKAAR